MSEQVATFSFNYGDAFKQIEAFLGNDLGRELRAAEEEISKRILTDSKNDHRYTSRTQNLRNATKVKGHINDKNSLGLSLYVDLKQAPYGKYIIRGTGDTTSDPFIDNAILKNQVWIRARLQQAIDNAIKIQNRKR